MKLSLAWLKEFVDLPEPPDAVAAALLRQGFEVTGISRAGGVVSNVVSAKVEAVDKHPNADKLRVCRVFDGSSAVTVVCGAPNVVAGGVYPLARPGGRLPGDLLIEKRALRGIDSYGMLCSARELGLGDDHAGLFALPEDSPLGRDVTALLSLDDVLLELDVTPNRPDALSHWGIARELAAAFGRRLKMPRSPRRSAPARKDLVTVREPACSRYIAQTLDGVTVGPSPLWLRLRLERCGVRSINNVVDVTNLVLLELGHPLHAFDRRTLSGGGVVVRRGTVGERLACLDGVERSVDGLLVIADADRSVAAAGVLGGLPTAVTEATVDLLLESAVFAPGEVRRTRRAFHVSTESSHRFERGSDPALAEAAARRATDLLLRLAGGRLSAVQDTDPQRRPTRAIPVRVDRLSERMGLALTAARVKKALKPLGFAVKGSGKALNVTPPVHRADVRESADVLEEVARMVGVDHIPPRVRGATVEPPGESTLRGLVLAARARFVGLGFFEAKTTGLVPRAQWEAWRGVGGETPVEVANPLSLSGECLSPSVLVNLISVAAGNVRRGNTNVRLFETARVFHGENGRVREADHFAWVAVGETHAAHWLRKPRTLDLWDAKAWMKAYLKDVRLAGVRWAASDAPFLHPVEAQSVWLGDTLLGAFGRVHPKTADAVGLPRDAFVGELNLTVAADGPRASVAFSGLSRQPALVRDFSMTFPDSVPWSSVVFWIHRECADVESVELFDVFTGGALAAGRRSLAFRVTFRHADRTLTESEGLAHHARVIQGLGAAFQAELRSAEA